MYKIYLDNIMKKSLVLMFMASFLVGCGSFYTGDQQIADGFGAINLENGGYYSGLIKNGQSNGYGKTITGDGAIYEGEHVNGVFHGFGKLTLSDGSYFVGIMEHNKVTQGQMHFLNGRAISISSE